MILLTGRMKSVQLLKGDCLELMKGIRDESVDLVLTDPPYNIGHISKQNNKAIKHEWDRIDGYIDWCIEWLKECTRVLTPNGVLYFWHNDINQISELLLAINRRVDLTLISFCIWDKGDSYRAQLWKNRDPNGATALRSWFNICEYCLHFFKTPKVAKDTGVDRINSNPECYKPIKEYYRAELTRLGLSPADVAAKYTEVTGKKPHMLRHYFTDSQFEIPTETVWDTVYRPLGFRKEYADLRKEYADLRKEYEDLRKEYEDLRNVHHCDPMHCNVWHHPSIPSNARFHPCEKPVDILKRLIQVSSNEGATVLDCFMGSGSTGVAAANTGRHFIGIEKDEKYFEIAKQRINDAVLLLPKIV